jgi:hypothetical protein
MELEWRFICFSFNHACTVLLETPNARAKSCIVPLTKRHSSDDFRNDLNSLTPTIFHFLADHIVDTSFLSILPYALYCPLMHPHFLSYLRRNSIMQSAFILKMCSVLKKQGVYVNTLCISTLSFPCPNSYR